MKKDYQTLVHRGCSKVNHSDTYMIGPQVMGVISVQISGQYEGLNPFYITGPI